MSPHSVTLDLSSSHFQMAALGHMSMPFCFVFCQYLSFFPGQVCLSGVSFNDIYPVLPWPSWFSFVTAQFPVCCLTSCSRVVYSPDVYKPSEPSFFNYIFQFPPVFFLMSSFLTLSLRVIPIPNSLF